MHLNLALIFLSLMLSCKTVHENTPLASTPANLQLETPEENLQLQTPEETEKVLKLDKAPNGFCEDDVYSTYLKEKLRQEQPPVVREPKSKSKKLSRKKKTFKMFSQKELAQMNQTHYARISMDGNTTPYYGTIPVVRNQYVDYWIHHFTENNRKVFLSWLLKKNQYEPILEPVLSEYGLPLEFVYLSMVESGFSVNAKSSRSATGPWQFMKKTAQSYGLKINKSVDERKDPVKSTRAAAKHLLELYEMFGDWYLAMAAYNAGAGRVHQAIVKAGTDDFWKLLETQYLPYETKNYVPKVLASLLISYEPEKYGFKTTDFSPEKPILKTVALFKSYTFRKLAQLSRISEDDLRRYNPEIKGQKTPVPTSSQKIYYVNLPEKHSLILSENLKKDL